MKFMTHLDLPVVRATGFQSGWSGHSWFKKDRHGYEWQVIHQEDNPVLDFVSSVRLARPMTREEFDDLFDYV
jgi:hypothetical protein